LPEVRHSGLSGTHEPPVQVPPQHSPFESHDSLSGVHASLEQVPSMHAKVQQSAPAWQSPPPATHVPGICAHRLSIGSQLSLQQSALAVQSRPFAVQLTTPSSSSSSSPPLSPHAPSANTTAAAKVKV
jgi:hypothetical protein